MEPLLPCPFCGSQIEMERHHDGGAFYADCPICGIVREFGMYFDDAVRKWNTRAKAATV